MAQNITLLGASYSAVPSVTLPKTGGGIATFTDTSDADATASDILSGKTAYVNGEKITGTGSGGGGMNVVETQDEHGGTIVTITGTSVTLQSKTNISPTSSSQTITPDEGYTGLSSVQINAMPSGSATAPATISGSSASVSTGTNTLTLSKTVSVTPSVSAGYVASGTVGNSAVSLTASVTTKGADTITPTSSNKTISSGTYLTGTQTIEGIACTNLTAANIKSGVTVKIGTASDDDSVTSVTGTYSGGGMNKQIYYGPANVKNNGYIASSAKLTVATTGKYKVSWTAWRSSSSGTMGTNLHKNSTSGTNQQTFTGTYGQCITLTNQSYTAGDVLTIYATSGSNSRTIYIANFVIEQTA